MIVDHIGTRISRTWKLARRTLDLGQRTLIMGIVNITPDSFSDGGNYLAPDRAVDHGLSLLDDGADILDLGAESTRPGSRAGSPDALTAREEQARLMPVLEQLRNLRPQALISVDTYKAATARQALDLGADIINDVSGFQWDPDMAATCGQAGCGVVLMHSRGLPQDWSTQHSLNRDELIATVKQSLTLSLAEAVFAGIDADSTVLDPGYGFGKRQTANYDLMARQGELLALGRPLLAGVSRKSFLAFTLDNAALQSQPGCISETAAQAQNSVYTPIARKDDPSRLEAASNAAMVAAILAGASIVRVHSVKSAVASSAIADALLRAV